MQDPVRRDTILTVVGMILMVAFFLLAVYMPGQEACDEAKAEIKNSERMISEIPLRVAELEKLNADLRERHDYLEQVSHLVPNTPDLHGVIRDAASLARQNHLSVTRLEPRDSVDRETIAFQPFHVTLSGTFADLINFLHGIESCDRLYKIESLALSREHGEAGQIVECNVDFFVFFGRTESPESTENNISGNFTVADRK